MPWGFALKLTSIAHIGVPVGNKSVFFHKDSCNSKMNHLSEIQFLLSVITHCLTEDMVKTILKTNEKKNTDD